MTTTSTATRPRITHSEPSGAQHSAVQSSATQSTAAKSSATQHTGTKHQRAHDIDVAAIDAALARITETATELARITESAAGNARRTNVADTIVTSLIRELTMVVRFVVRLDQQLLGGASAEFGKVVGWNPDDDQRSEICFGDPTACV